MTYELTRVQWNIYAACVICVAALVALRIYSTNHTLRRAPKTPTDALRDRIVVIVYAIATDARTIAETLCDMYASATHAGRITTCIIVSDVYSAPHHYHTVFETEWARRFSTNFEHT